jgi:organic radical activating enzyme
MDILQEFQEKGITIEQFVTKKCNFHCAHCMYDCGIDQKNEFLSDEMIQKLKKQIDFLKSMNIPIVVNILGGEPTLFFNKLKMFVNILSSWNVGIMMSTNGWWLEKEENTEKFFGIFEKLISEDGISKNSNNGNGLYMRISSDKFHEEFQKGNNNKNYFESLFLDKYSNIKPDDTKPWMYWQTLRDGYYINPKGRAIEISNADEYMKEYSYGKEKDCFCWNEVNVANGFGNHESIHYELDGHISDTCMFGSDYSGIGTINDNILYVIMLLKEYKNYRYMHGGYNCFNCRSLFSKWMKENLRNAKHFRKKFNNFDVDFWGKYYNYNPIKV